MRALLAVHARWIRLTTPYDPASPDAARFRSLQLQPLLALWPWLMAGTLVNAAAIAWVLRAVSSMPLLLLWATAALGVGLLGLRAWDLLRQGQWPAYCSTRTLAKVNRNAGIAGAVWGLPMALGYASAGDADRTALLLITEGLICAGTVALACVPRAAGHYVLFMTLGTLMGLMQSNWRDQALLLVLTLLYGCMVMAAVIHLARNSGARMEAEAQSSRQRQLMRLLLDDFEQHAQDWLWELDAQGRLSRAPQRMAQALGRRPVQLAGEELVQLISQTLARPTDEQQRALDALADALQDTEPFSQLQVPVMLAGQLHWWAFSGKRLADERGQWCGWRGVGSDVTRARQFGEEMTRSASHDGLTGLANREQLQARLDSYGERPFSLLCLDLCDFHQTNETHGQLVGDQVLQIVASRFRACVRQGDLLARIQGDSFALVSWGALPEHAAANAAKRLLDTLRQPCTVDGTLVPVSACVGIVQVQASAPVLTDLLEQAAQALAYARLAGPGVVAFWTPAGAVLPQSAAPSEATAPASA
jgi:diguanylate cyclase (GGDEF)-like protein